MKFSAATTKPKGRGGKSTSVLILIGSTTLKTCAITATTGKERLRWPHVAPKNRTTPVVSVRTAT